MGHIIPTYILIVILIVVIILIIILKECIHSKFHQLDHEYKIIGYEIKIDHYLLTVIDTTPFFGREYLRYIRVDGAPERNDLMPPGTYMNTSDEPPRHFWNPTGLPGYKTFPKVDEEDDDDGYRPLVIKTDG